MIKNEKKIMLHQLTSTLKKNFKIAKIICTFEGLLFSVKILKGDLVKFLFLQAIDWSHYNLLLLSLGTFIHT